MVGQCGAGAGAREPAVLRRGMAREGQLPGFHYSLPLLWHGTLADLAHEADLVDYGVHLSLECLALGP